MCFKSSAKFEEDRREHHSSSNKSLMSTRMEKEDAGTRQPVTKAGIAVKFRKLFAAPRRGTESLPRQQAKSEKVKEEKQEEESVS